MRHGLGSPEKLLGGMIRSSRASCEAHLQRPMEWLLAEDPSLPGGSAIASLRSGSKTEVRRRAQEHAF